LPLEQAQLAIVLGVGEKLIGEARPLVVPGPATPGRAPSGDFPPLAAASAALSGPAWFSWPGSQVQAASSPPGREAPLESLPPEEGPPAETAVPDSGQAAQIQGDVEQPRPWLAFEPPALVPGNWEDAARRFLRVLEALDSGDDGQESLWVRLGLWGMAAATTVVLFELGRQHIRKNHLDDLDPAPTRPWGSWELPSC
jgi:hypothetical protein